MLLPLLTLSCSVDLASIARQAGGLYHTVDGCATLSDYRKKCSSLMSSISKNTKEVTVPAL